MKDLQFEISPDSFEKPARNLQVGFTLAGWAIWGFLAYKFWGKSKVWNGVIIATGAYNLYSTYNAFSKPALVVESVPNEKPTPMPQVKPVMPQVKPAEQKKEIKTAQEIDDICEKEAQAAVASLRFARSEAYDSYKKYKYESCKSRYEVAPVNKTNN